MKDEAGVDEADGDAILSTFLWCCLIFGGLVWLSVVGLLLKASSVPVRVKMVWI